MPPTTQPTGPCTCVKVKTAAAAYEVRVGSGLLAALGHESRALSLGKRAAVLADANVASHALPAALQSLRQAGFDPVAYEVPAGEPSKSLDSLARVLSWLAQNRIGRDDFIVALGGGVVGDLAGFAAAAYLRGIAFIQVPTTLLAMVDSSVGGKTGVNLPEGKNLVGAFWQPRLVLADLALLATLPPREFSAGMAEVIKHGVIADAAILETVERGVPPDLAPLIRRNVEIKAGIVGEDERETSGRRALLNFGHTLGHAVENAVGYGELLHGECVAIGMAFAARLSHTHLGLPIDSVHRLERILQTHSLPTSLPPHVDRARVRAAMERDKKAKAGRLRWVLTPAFGSAVVVDNIDVDI